jgi:membrane protein
MLGTLRRTFESFQRHGMTDWAAALTYYGLLSLFPALLALVSLLGLFGDPEGTTKTVTDIVTEIGPDSAADTFNGPIEALTENRGAAGVLLVVGIALAVWSGSGYVGAFMRASNAIYETDEARSFWKRRPLQLLITLGMVLALAAVGIAVALTGPVADAVAEPLGIGDVAVDIWDWLKWPVLLGVAVAMVAFLYYSAPSAKLPGFGWLVPGVFLALAVWLVASVAFAAYVANFGSYNETYGALGGVVVLLIWMWITNAALLLGAELNAERERGALRTDRPKGRVDDEPPPESRGDHAAPMAGGQARG